MKLSAYKRNCGLAAWALGVLVATAAVRMVLGPLFLSRSVELSFAARNTGEKWTLEWLDAKGKQINGAWPDVIPESGAVEMGVAEAVPNYRFSQLALKWYGAPGTRLSDPGSPRLTERVLGLRFAPSVAPPVGLDQTTFAQGAWTTPGPDGGVAWSMPRWSLAQGLDLAATLLLVSAVAAALVGLLKLRAPASAPPRGSARAEHAALAVVIFANLWLAIRCPMFFCPDGMDYAVNALRLIRQPSMDIFNAWRLPGYSAFEAPFAYGWDRFCTPMGWAQSALAVLTAVLASRIVRQHLGRTWAAVVLLLVGLDPVLLIWSRHAMPESLSAFLATFMAWAVLRPRLWTASPLRLAIPAALGLGVLGAGLCLVRGNYQLLVLMAPFALAAGPLFGGRRWRAASVAAAMVLGAGAGLSPFVLDNYHKLHRAELVVGSGFARASSMISQKIMDPNQTAAFTREQWLKWRTAGLSDAASNEVYARLKTMKHTPIADLAAGLPAWTAFDVAAGEIARESIARHPGERWKTSAMSGVRLLALWNLPRRSENYFWSVLMRCVAREKSTQPLPPERYGHMSSPLIREVYSRTAADATGWMCGPDGRAFARMYDLLAMVRPLWSWLYLAGLLVVVMRRQWGLLVVGIIPLAHAAALAVLLLDGIDRYQAPLFPLMSVVACFAMAALARCLPRRRSVPLEQAEGPITTPPPPSPLGS